MSPTTQDELSIAEDAFAIFASGALDGVPAKAIASNLVQLIRIRQDARFDSSESKVQRLGEGEDAVGSCVIEVVVRAWHARMLKGASEERALEVPYAVWDACRANVGIKWSGFQVVDAEVFEDVAAAEAVLKETNLRGFKTVWRLIQIALGKKGVNFAIKKGVNGSRLTHSSGEHVLYLHQTFALWESFLGQLSR